MKDVGPQRCLPICLIVVLNASLILITASTLRNAESDVLLHGHSSGLAFNEASDFNTATVSSVDSSLPAFIVVASSTNRTSTPSVETNVSQQRVTRGRPNSVNGISHGLVEVEGSGGKLRVVDFIRSSAEWHSDEKCVRKIASCSLIPQHYVCFGAILPYSSTGGFSSSAVSERLEGYRKFEGLPDCWKQLRDVLCSFFIPPCVNSRVKLVSTQLCNAAKASCPFLVDNDLWPSELADCSNSSHFANPNQCQKSDDTKAQWKDVEPVCVKPLVYSQRDDGWIGVRHCGINCTSPFLTPSEHADVRQFLLVLALAVLAVNILAVLAFFVGNVENSLRWVFILQSIVCVCYLAQFAGSKHACFDDGTVQTNIDSNWRCTIQFFALYVAVIASGVWFSTYCVTYCWANAKTLVEINAVYARYSSYFHLVAWGSTLPFLTAVLSIGQVESDGISGICFVGYNSFQNLVVFVYMPLTVTLLPCAIMLVNDCYNKKSSSRIKTAVCSDNTYATFKLFALLGSLFLCLTVSLSLNGYEFLYWQDRLLSLRDYILCQLKAEDPQLCYLAVRLNVRLVQLHLSLLFLPAICFFCYVWSVGIFKSSSSRVYVALSELVVRFCRKLSCARKPKDCKLPAHSDAEQLEPGDSLAKPACNTIGLGSTSSLSDVDLHMANGADNLTDEGSGTLPRPSSRRRDFIQRLNSRNRHRRSATPRRSPSCASHKTTSSFRSDSIPLGFSPHSFADLGFPDLSKYPVLDADVARQLFLQQQQMAWASFMMYHPLAYFTVPTANGFTSQATAPMDGSECSKSNGLGLFSVSSSKRSALEPQLDCDSSIRPCPNVGPLAVSAEVSEKPEDLKQTLGCSDLHPPLPLNAAVRFPFLPYGAAPFLLPHAAAANATNVFPWNGRPPFIGHSQNLSGSGCRVSKLSDEKCANTDESAASLLPKRLIGASANPAVISETLSFSVDDEPAEPEASNLASIAKPSCSAAASGKLLQTLSDASCFSSCNEDREKVDTESEDDESFDEEEERFVEETFRAEYTCELNLDSGDILKPQRFCRRKMGSKNSGSKGIVVGNEKNGSRAYDDSRHDVTDLGFHKKSASFVAEWLNHHCLEE